MMRNAVSNHDGTSHTDTHTHTHAHTHTGRPLGEQTPHIATHSHTWLHMVTDVRQYMMRARTASLPRIPHLVRFSRGAMAMVRYTTRK